MNQLALASSPVNHFGNSLNIRHAGPVSFSFLCHSLIEMKFICSFFHFCSQLGIPSSGFVSSRTGSHYHTGTTTSISFSTKYFERKEKKLLISSISSRLRLGFGLLKETFFFLFSIRPRKKGVCLSSNAQKPIEV